MTDRCQALKIAKFRCGMTGKNGVELINRVFSGIGFRIALMPKDSVVLKMAVEAI